MEAECPRNYYYRSRITQKRRRVLIGVALATAGCFLQQVQIVQNYYDGSRRTATSMMDHGMANSESDAIGSSSSSSSNGMLPTNFIRNVGNSDSDRIEDDIHSSHVTILPLQDWEEASMQGLVEAAAATNTTIQTADPQSLLTCHPPPHIPPQCCIGTFAGMGRIVPNHMRQQCAHEDAIQSILELPQMVERELEDTTTTTTRLDGCDICHILEYLQRHQQSLTFLGDSMTHQTVQGLVCELHRRNYRVEETVLRFHNPAEDRRRGGRGRKGRKNKAETASSNNNNNNNNTTDSSVMTTECTGINHCLHLVRTIRVSSPLWTPTRNVTIQFFHHYRLPFADTVQRDMVLQAASNGVLIVNYGLHWGANYHGRRQEPIIAAAHDTDDNTHRESYSGVTNPDHPPNPQHLEGALADFLNQLADARVAGSKNHHDNDDQQTSRVFLRETSAQHFDAPEGDFSFVKRTGSVKERRQSTATIARSNLLQRDPLQCVPHPSRDDSISNATIEWRQTVFHRAAQRANYTVTVAGQPSQPHPQQPHPQQQQQTTRRSLTVLPFADFTNPLHGLHPYEQGGKGGDCTHYCSSPYLYMPLWRSIRLALDVVE